MPLKDYLELVEPFAPVYGGKPYPLPPVGARSAVRVLQHIDPDSDVRIPGVELERILLGDQAKAMDDDDVPQDFIVRVLFAAMADVAHGRGTAEKIWERGADPKAFEAWAAEQGLPLSTPAVEATTTP